MELLLVTPRPEVWNECLPVFQRGGNTLQQAASLEDAAPIIRHTPPVLAILDLELEGKALRQAVIDIMMINASVHTAVVSDMDPDEFHEATEARHPHAPAHFPQGRRCRTPPQGSCRGHVGSPYRAPYGETPCEGHAPSAPLERRALLRWEEYEHQLIAVSAPTRRDLFEPDSYPP